MPRLFAVLLFTAAAISAACNRAPIFSGTGAPPPTRVVDATPGTTVEVADAAQFPLVAATTRALVPQLQVTGSIAPDIARTVPVVSLASGRVLEVNARLGDTVTRGQLLMRVQSADIADAVSALHNAQADAQLAATQLARARDLYAHGAVALGDLQIADNAAAKATTSVADAQARLRVLGVSDPAAATGIFDVRAPIAGVITDQQVTAASGLQGLSSPNPFTISDLSSVWVLCDVYEDDLRRVQLGDRADIRLDAYPDRVLTGRVGNIGALLDPSTRSAKVRIEVRNPGAADQREAWGGAPSKGGASRLRPGMFVTATIFGARPDPAVVIPATAVIRLHDLAWVFVPLGASRFQRRSVAAGPLLPGGLQAISSGLAPGQRVVANALQFSAAVAQQ